MVKYKIKLLTILMLLTSHAALSVERDSEFVGYANFSKNLAASVLSYVVKVEEKDGWITTHVRVANTLCQVTLKEVEPPKIIDGMKNLNPMLASNIKCNPFDSNEIYH